MVPVSKLQGLPSHGRSRASISKSIGAGLVSGGRRNLTHEVARSSMLITDDRDIKGESQLLASSVDS